MYDQKCIAESEAILDATIQMLLDDKEINIFALFIWIALRLRVQVVSTCDNIDLFSCIGKLMQFIGKWNMPYSFAVTNIIARN